MEPEAVLDNVRQVAAGFAERRRERQQRTYLDRADFDALAEAGMLLTGVPESLGGLWVDVAKSTRPICEILRVLATGDPAVALVSAMHPAVLGFWLTRPEAPAPYAESWQAQTAALYQTALDGHWWGTVTSEPGSGGDVTRSRATARREADGSYRISGQKHFGSGSGISSYMLTSAVPEGETDADFYYIETRGALDSHGVPLESASSIRLVAPWDGYGMSATQSHAFELTDYPAQRIAWPGSQSVVSGAAGAFFSALFTGVIVGVVQSAHAAALQRIAPRARELAAVRGGRVGAGGDGVLDDRAGVRAAAAACRGEGLGGDARRSAREAGDRGAGGVGNAANVSGYRRRELLAVVALRGGVRRRAGTGVPAAAVGAGV